MRPFVVLATLLTSLAASAWTPPGKPDAKAILNEARADRMAGRYEDALQKHRWFHHEALKHEPALVGVRGSFAIDDWANLADKYPPAREALLKERAVAAQAVVQGREVSHNFSDVAAIDRALDEHQVTYSLFRVLELRDEAEARRVFRFAHDTLVEAKDFARCAKYLDVEAELQMIRDRYKDLERPQRVSFPGLKAMEERFARDKAAHVVALLVLGNRSDDARKLAHRVKAEFRDPELEPVLARALEGQLPPPLVPPEAQAAWKKIRP